MLIGAENYLLIIDISVLTTFTNGNVEIAFYGNFAVFLAVPERWQHRLPALLLQPTLLQSR